MGLHCDVKKYLRARFPSAVNARVPAVKCEVQIVDLMWLLFKFYPDEHGVGADLIDFFWRPIERFFQNEGLVYVCVFDAAKHVPNAKAEEHRRRYGAIAEEDRVPLEKIACDDENLPTPWRAALADSSVRRATCAYICEGLQKRFKAHATKLAGKQMYVSGLADVVLRIDSSGSAPSKEYSAAASIGEGDLAVAYWAQQFHNRPTIARVLDSDQIPILQLRASIGARRAPLFVWLVSPKRDPEIPPHGYGGMPPEGYTLVDVLALNAAVVEAGMRVEEFCYQVICQKTDFVDKIIHNLGVAATLAGLEKHASNGILVTASAASFDAVRVKESFARAALQSKRKRAEVRNDARQDSDVEFRRAWWTLCYWSFGWEGKLREQLVPNPAFGFDAEGLRTRSGRTLPFPAVVANL
jgi:hypothetical protein